VLESMEDLFNLSSRHLVGVVLRYSDPRQGGEGIFRYLFPGFLLQLPGAVFLPHSGSYLKKVEDAVAAGKMRIAGALLATTSPRTPSTKPQSLSILQT